MSMRMIYLAPTALVLFVCGACDRVSFSFHHRRPVHEVHVVETHPVEEVRVIETYPVHEVHVVETRPHARVRLHHDHHVCTRHCDHYFDGSAFITIGLGHRHGPHCGHHFNGKHWVFRKGIAHKARRHHSAPRKYKKRH